MKRIACLLTAAELLAGSPVSLSAQTAQPLKTDCSQPGSGPATPMNKGQGSGTAPGSSGSTGWSGSGLGGSYNGTSPSGPNDSSPSFQPVTAKGIDPIRGMMGKPAKTC